jgi:hypothetical protein
MILAMAWMRTSSCSSPLVALESVLLTERLALKQVYGVIDYVLMHMPMLPVTLILLKLREQLTPYGSASFLLRLNSYYYYNLQRHI